MAQYEYGRIRKLAIQLEAHGIIPEVCDEIMAGGEDIKRRTPTKLKHAWLKEAMEHMDALIERDKRQEIREACACCLGGKRGELTKSIGQDHDTLEERIAAANEVHAVGHSMTVLEDGRIEVVFDAPGKDSYRCVCIPQAEMPVSETYCYCCAGHIKHHLQQALVLQAECEVVETALTSAGKAPCTFMFTLLD